MERGALGGLLDIMTAIEGLSAEERELLFQALCEEYGWAPEPAKGNNRGVSAGDFGAWEDSAVKDYDLILVEVGQERLPVLQMLREVCGVDPAGAKELLKSLPAVVGKGLDLGEARALERRFSECGARTEVCERAHTQERLEELKRGDM